MKILLFGKNGQVGWELNRLLVSLGEVVALGREDADLSEPESLREIIRKIEPDVIVNAAAYTAVDKAEDEEKLATAINGAAPGIMAEEAERINALLVHYSTDYVFDGELDRPYTENDSPNPINAYGRSKLAGEREIQKSGCRYLIFRTSWIYSSRGKNFLLTILKLAREMNELSIVSDQFGSPTWADMVAKVTLDVLRKVTTQGIRSGCDSGIFHLVARGSTSWHGFAQSIVSKAENALVKKIDVKPILSSEYQTRAMRPKNSRLDINKLEQCFGLRLPGWEESLNDCMRTIA